MPLAPPGLKIPLAMKKRLAEVRAGKKPTLWQVLQDPAGITGVLGTITYKPSELPFVASLMYRFPKLYEMLEKSPRVFDVRRALFDKWNVFRKGLIFPSEKGATVFVHDVRPAEEMLRSYNLWRQPGDTLAHEGVHFLLQTPARQAKLEKLFYKLKPEEYLEVANYLLDKSPSYLYKSPVQQMDEFVAFTAVEPNLPKFGSARLNRLVKSMRNLVR